MFLRIDFFGRDIIWIFLNSKPVNENRNMKLENVLPYSIVRGMRTTSNVYRKIPIKCIKDSRREFGELIPNTRCRSESRR